MNNKRTDCSVIVFKVIDRFHSKFIIMSKKRQLKRETYSAAASVEMFEGGVSPLVVDIIINKKRLLKRETYSAVASVEMLEGGVSPFVVDIIWRGA